MSVSTRKSFTGSNNIAKPERLPEGAVVDALNMDFTVGEKAELRVGFEKILDSTGVRAIFSMGDGAVAIADGSQLLRLHNGVTSVITSIGPGPVAATMFNDKLYLNTMYEALEIGQTTSPWVISPPTIDISIGSGTAAAGVYKIAVTTLIDGKESGCTPYTLSLTEGQSIGVSVSPAAGTQRLYASVANGTTLYLQGVVNGFSTVNSPVDDTEVLSTAGLQSMPRCDILDSYKGFLIGAAGRFVYISEPMQPHLHNPETGYLQFPADVDLLVPADGGFFVCADKTYFISDLGTERVEQRVVLEFGGIPGTSVALPDGSAAWFSRYGQVVTRENGQVEQLNRATYSPDTASQGASGVLEHNGNQFIVTTMRGEQNASCLKSTDHWELEII